MRDHTRARVARVVAVLVAGALCAGCSAGDRNVSLELRIVQETPADSLTKMIMSVWGGEKTYYAHREVLLTEADVAAAMVVTDDGAPAIKLVFLGEAQQKLLRVTEQNIGGRLGVIIDDQLQCQQLIEEPIDSGIVMVTGRMLEHGAKQCSRALTRKVT